VTLIRRFVGTGFVLAVIVASLSLAACGGGGDDNGGGPSIINVDQGPTQSIIKAEQVIKVTDNAFSPENVTIKAGTKVIWQWEGTSNPHSIQLGGQTSTQQTSGTFERNFEQAGGNFSYQCGVHGAAMAGKLTIE
jgi:plastocyanin